MTQHIVRVKSIYSGEVFQFSVDDDSLAGIRQRVSEIFKVDGIIYLKHDNEEVTTDDQLQKLFRTKSKPLTLNFGTQNKVIIPLCNRETKRQQAKLNAKFVRHVTYPDGYQVGVGQIITKTWRLQNNGRTAWPQKLKVIFVKTKARPININLTSPILPGGEADISIKITIPDLVRKYTGEFRLAWGDGLVYPFGARFSLDIQAIPTYDLFECKFNGIFPSVSVGSVNTFLSNNFPSVSVGSANTFLSNNFPSVSVGSANTFLSNSFPSSNVVTRETQYYNNLFTHNDFPQIGHQPIPCS